MASLEPFRIQLSEQAHQDLRERVARTRWPSQPAGERWELGMDFAWLRELCEHWAGAYDWGGYEGRLNELPGFRRNGIHFWHVLAKGEGLPILLVHGWPGGPIEFREAIPRLRAAGHDVVVPSLPGYAWSEDPGAPLNVTAIADRLRELMEEGLGYPRYAVQGGDWGAVIAARMAFDSPASIVALHTNTPALLPPPADLANPPLSEAEQSFAQAAQRWPLRDGAYLLLQGTLPDTLAAGLHDSPAGLAAWLVDKYRRWSDCDGEVERRFSKDDLCDLLTMYWSTGTIASSMRLYYGERRGRWRLQPGERIDVPAAAADFPAEVLRAPREWAERTLTDLRRWTEMPRGGHFAAFEEPELFSRDLLEFLAEVRRCR